MLFVRSSKPLKRAIMWRTTLSRFAKEMSPSISSSPSPSVDERSDRLDRLDFLSLFDDFLLLALRELFASSVSLAFPDFRERPDFASSPSFSLRDALRLRGDLSSAEPF